MRSKKTMSFGAKNGDEKDRSQRQSIIEKQLRKHRNFNARITTKFRTASQQKTTDERERDASENMKITAEFLCLNVA